MLFVIAMDGDASRRRQLILRGAALVSVISAWMMIRFRRRLTARPQISYGPMHPRDEQRQKNLSYIYNSNDTQCINQPRMKRSPSTNYATCSIVVACSKILSTATSKSRLPCSFES